MTTACSRFRPPRFLPALVILALAVSIAGNAAVAGEPAPTVDISVMSFNIRYGAANDGENAWDRRRELVASTINEFAPDLLGTQECLLFQKEFLAERLPGYQVVGAGRDDGADGGEMCAVFFRDDRFELLDAGHFWLSDTPDQVGSVGWDAALTRMATWVKLRVCDVPDHVFYFFNTHFDHVGEEARLASARLVRAMAVERIGAGLPVIIAGDFNSPATLDGDSPHRALTGAGQPRLLDTYEVVHESPHATPPATLPATPPEPTGTFNGFTGETERGRIDWIIVSRHFVSLAAAIDRSSHDGRYPSDHFPVTANLRLTPTRCTVGR